MFELKIFLVWGNLMNYVILIFKVLVFTGIITILAKQSYNLFFFFLKKPIIWILSMFILNFLFFLIGSKIQSSFNAFWWSSFLALLALSPPKKNKEDQKSINKTVDEVYEDWGIKKGRLKYKLGLGTYILGGLAGWIIFYGEIVTSK